MSDGVFVSNHPWFDAVEDKMEETNVSWIIIHYSMIMRKQVNRLLMSTSKYSELYMRKYCCPISLSFKKNRA